MLKIDREKARAALIDGEAETFDRFTSTDSADSLLAYMQDDAKAITSSSTTDAGNPGERIYIYPLSESEPDLIVAVNRGVLTLLGSTIKLYDADEAEHEIEYTVGKLAEIVDEANDQLATLDRQAIAGTGGAEAAARIAQGVPTGDEWRSAADFMERTAALLDRFGVERPEHYDEAGAMATCDGLGA